VYLRKDDTGFLILVSVKKEFRGTSQAKNLVDDLSAKLTSHNPVDAPIRVASSDLSFNPLK